MSTPQHPVLPAPAAQPYAAPYQPPVHPQYGAALTPAPARRSPMLGIVALIAAGLAAIAPLVAAVAAFRIGLGTGHEIAAGLPGADFDLSLLTPVRDWVILGEASFWVGTALGVWALVQGIIAVVTNRGRIAGIVALVIAVLAPVVFAVATSLSLSTGFGAV